jgi:chemotaxis protein methyltransferase CheR
VTGGPGVARFRELLGRLLGWTFDDGDAAQLGRVLADRAARHGLSRDDYLTRLGSGQWAAEVTDLVEGLGITETYFFRHGDQLQALREAALPERIAARAARRVLRMLSVGCSSGEEVYTLAIVARQVQPDPDWIISVTGVDVNPAMLRRAAGATYSSWSLRETPDPVRRRWFRPQDGGYRVADEVRSLVNFRQYNVADDDPGLWLPDRYDVILCRNLLMYLARQVASGLVDRMTGALAPGGYLFLGHTDSLGSRPVGLELQHTHRSFYYRRPVTSPPAAAAGPPPAAGDVPVGWRDAPAEDAHNRAVALLHEERFAEALDLVATGSPGEPDTRDTLLRGVLLALCGRLDDATATARRLIDGDLLYPDAHQLLGLCLEEATAVDEAVGQYRLAAYLDPAFALPRLRLGQLARRRGDERAAAVDLRQALALLAQEDDERITLFGGGFGRIALTVLCRAELDACGARR